MNIARNERLRVLTTLVRGYRALAEQRPELDQMCALGISMIFAAYPDDADKVRAATSKGDI